MGCRENGRAKRGVLGEREDKAWLKGWCMG